MTLKSLHGAETCVNWSWCAAGCGVEMLDMLVPRLACEENAGAGRGANAICFSPTPVNVLNPKWSTCHFGHLGLVDI